MGTGFNKRKKQAKMMQEQFMQMQEKLKDMEIIGSGGNGLVEVYINGDGDLQKIKIKPDCVDPEDVEGLEDLIQAAFKDAQEKLKKESPMGNLPGLGSGGEMPNLPPGFGNLGL